MRIRLFNLRTCRAAEISPEEFASKLTCSTPLYNDSMHSYFLTNDGQIAYLPGRDYDEAVRGRKIGKDAELPDWKPVFSKLQLNLTTRCNLACRYCYSYAGRHEETMSPEIAIKAIDFALRYSKDILTLQFVGGGEQTLEFETMKKAVEHARSRIRTAVILSTNGVLTEEKISWIIRNTDNLQISYDGTSYLQDKLRPFQNGSASSGIVEDTIRRLVKEHKKFQVKFLLHNETYENRSSIIKNLISLGVSSIQPAYLVAKGRGKGFDALQDSKANAAILELTELAQYVEYLEPIYLADPEKYTCSFVVCGLMDGRVLSVNPNGDLFCCTGVSGSYDYAENPLFRHLRIGYYSESGEFVFEPSQMEILRAAFRKNMHDKGCNLCPGQNFCVKTCFAENIQLYKSLEWGKCISFGNSFFYHVLKYKIENNIKGFRPYIEKKGVTLSFRMLHNEFILSSGAYDANPLITITGADDIEKIRDEIVSHAGKSRDLTVYLLRIMPHFRRGFREFFSSLRENRIFFIILRPFRCAEDAKAPDSCHSCYDLFHVKDGRVVFCNGREGRRYEEYPDFGSIYSDFEEPAEISYECSRCIRYYRKSCAGFRCHSYPGQL